MVYKYSLRNLHRKLSLTTLNFARLFRKTLCIGKAREWEHDTITRNSELSMAIFLEASEKCQCKQQNHTYIVDDVTRAKETNSFEQKITAQCITSHAQSAGNTRSHAR